MTFDPIELIKMPVPVGNVLGSIGKGEDDISQRRERQTLTPAPLSGPADVCLAAAQIQEVKATPTGHCHADWEGFIVYDTACLTAH